MEELAETNYTPSAMMPLTVPWAATMGARRPRPRRVMETILCRSIDMLIYNNRASIWERWGDKWEIYMVLRGLYFRRVFIFSDAAAEYHQHMKPHCAPVKKRRETQTCSRELLSDDPHIDVGAGHGVVYIRL